MDAETVGRRRKGEAASVRVHHFASLASADSSQALTAELRPLIARGFTRRAWVNLWNVHSSHQYLLLPSSRASELESGARHHGAAVLGMNDEEVTVSTRIGAKRGEPGHKSKTEVSFFAAGSQEIRQRLRPIIEAGFVVEGVTTPCGALWSQSRLRRPSLPGQVDAHVALGVRQCALGIFSDGSLLYARDLDWGYGAPGLGPLDPRAREEIAARLSAELRRSFLYLKQYWEDDVSQVLLCGDMPEVRSLVAPLIERLNIEVETLDTLEGFDTPSLPDGFAEQAAAFRLAFSIAAEPPPVNLLPVEVAAERTSRTVQRIVAAGTAAAVVLGAFLYAQASVKRQEAERQISVLHREMSYLRSRVEAVNASQTRAGADITQRAAFGSLDAQGPAVAGLLETIGNALPTGSTLRSVRAIPDGEYWRVTIEAVAAGSDMPDARSIADAFLRRLKEPGVFGDAVQLTTKPIIAGSASVELTVTGRVSR